MKKGKRVKTEPITARLPLEYKEVAMENWPIPSMEFNFSIIIREALNEYYLERKWIDGRKSFPARKKG